MEQTEIHRLSSSETVSRNYSSERAPFSAHPHGYQSGFANEFATEAMPGVLPVGRNSPQRVAHGLYAEQLRGTAFSQSPLMAVPNPASSSSPTVFSYESLESGRRLSATLPTPPNQLRWDPLPIPSEPTDFIDGLVTMAGNGSAEAMSGCAVHLYAANRSMGACYFYSADGELLIVPQQGRLSIATELGVLEVEPQEITVIPRGVRFQVKLPDGSARGYICENFGALLQTARPGSHWVERSCEPARLPHAARLVRG